jgi:hypothetical protein
MFPKPSSQSVIQRLEKTFIVKDRSAFWRAEGFLTTADCHSKNAIKSAGHFQLAEGWIHDSR